VPGGGRTPQGHAASSGGRGEGRVTRGPRGRAPHCPSPRLLRLSLLCLLMKAPREPGNKERHSSEAPFSLHQRDQRPWRSAAVVMETLIKLPREDQRLGDRRLGSQRGRPGCEVTADDTKQQWWPSASLGVTEPLPSWSLSSTEGSGDREWTGGGGRRGGRRARGLCC
jgi:hypothetical protein